jgi:hypothetical protein
MIVVIPPELEPSLKQAAQQNGIAPEDYALEILRRETKPKTKPAWVGMGNSGRSDLSSRTKELLFQTLEHPSNDK